MRRWKLLALAGGTIVLLVFATFALTAPRSDDRSSPPAVEPTSSGPLDGHVFAANLGLAGEAPDVEDTLVFANGSFVSTECEARCSYPATPYLARREGDRVHFISETRCPYKDATIVWRGTVENGTIEGESTWTVRRWYWTVEKKFRFEGTLAASQ